MKYSNACSADRTVGKGFTPVLTEGARVGNISINPYGPKPVELSELAPGTAFIFAAPASSRPYLLLTYAHDSCSGATREPLIAPFESLGEAKVNSRDALVFPLRISTLEFDFYPTRNR